MTEMIDIVQISWEEIYPIWSEKLWPNRQSLIEPISSMKYLGGYDKKIKDNTPYFIGAKIDKQIVGVNSIFKTENLQARSRGIWVDPKHRMSSVGYMIMTACIDIIKTKENIKEVWSAPRKSALSFYQKCGFVQTSDFTDDGFEFGPNCFVLKNV